MKRSQAGMFLIEMLVTIAIFAIILGITGMVFAEIIRSRGAQERYQQRRDAALHLIQRVAREVRESQGFLDSAEGVVADANTLILQLNGDIVLYRSEPGEVRRTVLGDPAQKDAPVLDAKGVEVRFDVEGTSPQAARCVVVTAEWTEHPKVGISHPTLSLRAARRAQP